MTYELFPYVLIKFRINNKVRVRNFIYFQEIVKVLFIYTPTLRIYIENFFNLLLAPRPHWYNNTRTWTRAELAKNF